MPSIIFALLLLLAPLPAAGEFIFLSDHPGKLTATVTGSHKALGKTDAALYKRNLERLRNHLAKQPVLTNPRGVDIIGYFRPNDEQPKTTKVPIPGFGFLRFHFLQRDRKTGKPFRICCTTDEIFISVNDPGKGFDQFSAVQFPGRSFYEPRIVSELNGFPVYRLKNGNEVILLNRSSTPLWIPLTREEYVAGWLKYWQKEAAGAPAADTLTPQIVRNHQAALDAMPPLERKMQARHYPGNPMEPTLAPVGSDEGEPLVMVNPAWFTPSLPRSAFQLIMLQFNYTGNLNHNAPGPTEHGNVAPYRVWQALHTSNWEEISGALTNK